MITFAGRTPRRARFCLRAASTILLAALWSNSSAAMDTDDPGIEQSGDEDPALHSEAQRRLRAYRAVALAQYLELDEEQALALNAVITRYDEQRRETQAELAAHMRILRRASETAEPDPDEVGRAVEGVLAARTRLESIRQEEARELIGRLDPLRQARLLVFFGEFPREVRRLMHEGRRPPGRQGEGPPPGRRPHRGPPPP